MNDARLCVTWKQRFQGNNYRKPPTKGDKIPEPDRRPRGARLGTPLVLSKPSRSEGGQYAPMTKYRSPPVASSRLTTFGLQCTLSFNLVGGGVPPKEGHSSLLCVYMTYTQSVTFLRLWGRQLPFLALLLMAICLPPFLLKGRDLSDVLHVYQYQALDFSLYSFRWQESRSEFSYILSYIIFMWFLI